VNWNNRYLCPNCERRVVQLGGHRLNKRYACWRCGFEVSIFPSTDQEKQKAERLVKANIGEEIEFRSDGGS